MDAVFFFSQSEQSLWESCMQTRTAAQVFHLDRLTIIIKCRLVVIPCVTLVSLTIMFESLA